MHISSWGGFLVFLVYSGGVFEEGVGCGKGVGGGVERKGWGERNGRSMNR